VNQLKVHMAQVRCSSCGAPVNLERDAQCGYCLLAGKRFERKMARIEGSAVTAGPWIGANVVDLVGEALDFLMSDA
jgi:hypothetical protein